VRGGDAFPGRCPRAVTCEPFRLGAHPRRAVSALRSVPFWPLLSYPSIPFASLRLCVRPSLSFSPSTPPRSPRSPR
jgi:hypothetical protein